MKLLISNKEETWSLILMEMVYSTPKSLMLTQITMAFLMNWTSATRYDDSIDLDKDGIIDGCDSFVDSDGDQVRDIDDVCPGFDDTVDTDQDGIPDGCDPSNENDEKSDDADSIAQNTQSLIEENSTVIIAGIGLFIAILLALMFIRHDKGGDGISSTHTTICTMMVIQIQSQIV